MPTRTSRRPATTVLFILNGNDGPLVGQDDPPALGQGSSEIFLDLPCEALAEPGDLLLPRTRGFLSRCSATRLPILRRAVWVSRALKRGVPASGGSAAIPSRPARRALRGSR